MRGFTLIELLIVIAIIGILLSLVVGLFFSPYVDCKDGAKADCVAMSYSPMECNAHIENTCGEQPEW